jgi:RNA polymerase sigma-70 factor (sigma-E family)
MSRNSDPVPGAPGEQEPLGELFEAVFELAGQAAARLGPDEVDARLRRIVRKASRPAGMSFSRLRKAAGVTSRGNCHPDRRDAAQGGSVRAFPRRDTHANPATPESPPAHPPATSSPDVSARPAAAARAPELPGPARDSDPAAPSRPLIAAAVVGSQARPRGSGIEAPGHHRIPVPLPARGGAGAITVTTDTLLAELSLGSAPAEWDAARAVTAIYVAHYRSLVRLAVLLVRDVATAEEVVQDSFIAMHAAWSRLRDTEKALSYLRQSVVNRSRSVLRHRVVVDKNAPKPAPDMPSAEQGAISLLERSAVIDALRTLPPKQREALVLKFYADLSEAQIATAMGISRGAVKSHTAKGVAALRVVLETER